MVCDWEISATPGPASAGYEDDHHQDKAHDGADSKDKLGEELELVCEFAASVRRAAMVDHHREVPDDVDGGLAIDC